jgi:hypothetical protein
MIPLMLVIAIRNYKHRGFRLWIPLFLLWLLLLPLVLVLLPLALIVLVVVGVNPFRAVAAGWQFLAGFRGTHIEVEDDRAFVLVRIM